METHILIVHLTLKPYGHHLSNSGEVYGKLTLYVLQSCLHKTCTVHKNLCLI